MKTAIIYSGAMRSFDKCWKNHAWQIWRHFPGARFYCVTEDDDDAQKIKLIPEGMNGKLVKQPEMVIPAGCPSEWRPGSPYMHEPYHISVDPRAVLGQLWMLRDGWRLYQEANDPADLIIRIRPDLWFREFLKPLPDERWTENPSTAYTPWWGRFGNGVNDRFALLGGVAAEAYFTAYDHIPAMIAEGAPLHPETLVGYAMERTGIAVHRDMHALFGTLRKNGEMREPEIIASDMVLANRTTGPAW